MTLIKQMKTDNYQWKSVISGAIVANNTSAV